MWLGQCLILVAVLVNLGYVQSEEDYNVLNRDGSYEFGYDNPDSYHHSQGNRNNVVRGEFGSRNSDSGGFDAVEYTAGPRGFRPRGKNIVRKYNLNQNGPRPIGSPEDPYYDPNEDPSYNFAFNTRIHSRQESANRAGDVTGKYSYLDDVGERHNVEYIAGKRTGFHVKTPFPDSNPRAYGPLYFNGRGRPIPRGRTAIQRGLDGSYRFISAGPDQRRTETSDASGHVRGSYTYLDDKGVQHSVHYVAGPEIGYRVLKNVKGPHLPTVYPFGRPEIIPSDFYDYLAPQGGSDVFDTAASGHVRPGGSRKPSKPKDEDDKFDFNNGVDLGGVNKGTDDDDDGSYKPGGRKPSSGGGTGSSGSGGDYGGQNDIGDQDYGKPDKPSSGRPGYEDQGDDDGNVGVSDDDFDLFGTDKKGGSKPKPSGGGRPSTSTGINTSQGGQSSIKPGGSQRPTGPKRPTTYDSDNQFDLFGHDKTSISHGTSSGSDSVSASGAGSTGTSGSSNSQGPSSSSSTGSSSTFTSSSSSGADISQTSGGSGVVHHIGIRPVDGSHEDNRGTLVTNVGDKLFAVPPGVSVRAHVQAIDLLPLGPRSPSPSDQYRAETKDQLKAESVKREERTSVEESVPLVDLESTTTPSLNQDVTEEES